MNPGAAIRSYSLNSMRSEAPTPGQRAWRIVLTMAAAGYRTGVAVRAWTFASGLRGVRRLPCPVICVGNLTVGGSGKTPCTIALAQWFQARGRYPGILLRGYGRHGSGVTVAADARADHARWEAVGDEAMLLARHLPGVPVVVGANRFQAGMEALRRFRLDVLLLDDGFQHRQLHRDLDLAMVDATDPFGGGRLLPRGRLREPVSSLGRAHAIILSRSDQASDLPGLRRCLERIAPGVVQILTRHRPSRLTELEGGEERPLSSLQGRRLLAVSGIANPAAFHRTLTALGGVVAGAAAFPDHHPYAPADLSQVARAAHEVRAELVVTTEKDAVRMPVAPTPEAASAPPIRVLEVELEVTEGTDSLERLLMGCGGGTRG
ncbi:MAG: tetraacyldisaccharide 4'-kinase [candidate division NC10 bacterium]|nr:tetraacyldisaccharide 4'-kinase [candidate division NC10 bacterium]